MSRFRALVIVGGLVRWAGAVAGEAATAPPAWISDGPTCGSVSFLRQDPHDPERLWTAFSYNGRLFHSGDGGRRWSEIAAFDEYLWIRDIVFSPTREGTLYAATFGQAGVLRSDDGGHSWREVSAELPTTLFSSLAIDPKGRLYVRSGYDGIFATDDGGESWETLLGGDENFYALAIDPGDPDVLEASLTQSGVIRSEDRGRTWFPAGSGLPGPVGHLTFDPHGSGRLWAAAGSADLYTSADGVSWTFVASLGGAFESILDLLVDAENPGTLLAATSRGLQRSVDGGATWNVVAFPGEVVRTVVQLSALPTTFGAGTDEGVFVSSDGLAWRKRSDGLNVAVMASLETELESRVVYTGADDCSGVLVSRDAGRTWQAAVAVSEDAEDGGVLALEVWPDRFSRALAGVDGRVYRTRDAGRTWTRAQLPSGTPGVVRQLATDRRRPARAFVATTARLARSEDAGETWEVLLTSVPWGGFTSVALVPSRPQWVWAVGRLVGPILSRDGGESWEVRAFGVGPGTGSIAADPFDGQTAYLTRSPRGGPSRTRNGGLSWEPIGPPSAGGVVGALVPHPRAEGVLAAAIGGRVWISCSRGDGWSELEDAPQQVLQLAWGDEGLLLAGTERQGVFRSPDAVGADRCR